MTSAEYEIVPYGSEWDQQVAELMVYLWGPDLEANLAYLRWKYEGNPYAEQPLALVAVRQGRAVGFRGYTAVPFQIAGASEHLIVLCPGDTCVHPEHRMSGLSVRIGRAAMTAYADRYRLFMNWSCTKPSLPGYLKLGFLALADKVYLTHAGPQGTLRYLLASVRALPVAQGRIRFGQTGELLVSAAPRPAEMAALDRADEAALGTLVLRRDEAFLAWRFANPLGKYIFYYLLRDETLLGYVAVGLSRNNRRGYLLDYAEAAPGILEGIVRGILRMQHFDVLSVYPFCLSAAQRRALEKLGFGVVGLIPFLERLQKGRLPLLLRPVKETFSDEDFFVQDIDARRIENWSLRPLGSDAE